RTTGARSDLRSSCSNSRARCSAKTKRRDRSDRRVIAAELTVSPVGGSDHREPLLARAVSGSTKVTASLSGHYLADRDEVPPGGSDGAGLRTARHQLALWAGTGGTGELVPAERRA